MRLYLQGFKLWLGFLVGRVPVHAFRRLMYKRVFGMRIGEKTSVHWRLAFFATQGIALGSKSKIGND